MCVPEPFLMIAVARGVFFPNIGRPQIGFLSTSGPEDVHVHTRSWMGKRTLGAEGLASPGHRSALVILCEREMCVGAAVPLPRWSAASLSSDAPGRSSSGPTDLRLLVPRVLSAAALPGP